MKIKLGMLKLSEPALQKLLTADIDVQSAWKLRKAFAVIKKELEILEDVRIKLVNKYGTKDVNGNINVVGDKLVDFLTEFNPLLEQEVELEYSGIPISVLLQSETPFSTLDLTQLEEIGLIIDDTEDIPQ